MDLPLPAAPPPGPRPPGARSELLHPPRLLPAPRDPAEPAATLADLLIRAGAAVLAARRGQVGRLGLPLTAVAVLDVLDRADGLVQRELAARVQVGPTTLTPVLDALEERGLVARRVDPGDRRIRRVTITGAGRGRLHAVRPAARGPRLPEPPPGHAGALREYLVAVLAFLEQDHPDPLS
ncbi:MarR family transcriptional regulator [Pseudonocardia sp. C8]|uniref:MarR family winged helix-turn-helix transcriptional regulator n=1 Tax=Pseudonocardia sp. C8 TaxID=2762759 RepID=UPI001642EDF5|nr:MarR family transcriptional regulator [Pseudonocardia sp. C8]MBC3193734.1 MarR family transcriptional regulator [Pseudonocardia sp. C8]